MPSILYDAYMTLYISIYVYRRERGYKKKGLWGYENAVKWYFGNCGYTMVYIWIYEIDVERSYAIGLYM
jgi:hypothetical protein